MLGSGGSELESALRFGQDMGLGTMNIPEFFN